MIESDVIIVGGGPVGCVLAERISSQLKLNCLIIEKRSHIGGNCYDEYNSKGLLYHKYGPHYLRFKNKKTMQYLSKFTKWLPGEYIVKSSVAFNTGTWEGIGERRTFVFAMFLNVENGEVPLNKKAFSKALQASLKDASKKF